MVLSYDYNKRKAVAANDFDGHFNHFDGHRDAAVLSRASPDGGSPGLS